MCGQPKYCNLIIVVKATLAVNHGQADVERGFSVNKHVVTESRVRLRERTIVAVRTVKDVLSRHDSVANVKIDRSLILRYRSAHASYKADLETAALVDQNAAQKSVELAKADTEKQIAQKRKSDIASKQNEAERLIAEANARLTKAAESKDMSEMLAAQALLQSGHAKLTEARKEKNDLDKPPASKKPKCQNELNHMLHFKHSLLI